MLTFVATLSFPQVRESVPMISFACCLCWFFCSSFLACSVMPMMPCGCCTLSVQLIPEATCLPRHCRVMTRHVSAKNHVSRRGFGDGAVPLRPEILTFPTHAKSILLHLGLKPVAPKQQARDLRSTVMLWFPYRRELKCKRRCPCLTSRHRLKEVQ